MSQILKLAHENQQLKRQINQYQQVLGVSPYVDDSLFKGGYRVVKTIADRDAIKCCWRKQGMKVVVIGDDLSFKEYILKSKQCSENIWEKIDVIVDEDKVFLTEDYSELGEDLSTQKDLNLVLKQILQNLQTQIDNIELTDEKVQITETTNFTQIGQTQKDFNKNVSDYKTSSDLKNQEQDDRLTNVEGDNTAQYDLINDLNSELDSERARNDAQDSKLGNIEEDLTEKLDKGTYTGTAQDLKTEIDGKLDKPTTTSTTNSYPYVVGEDGNGNSARLPAGDLGKNFFNSDLSNTTARNHTMNAGVTVNTLGNPHTLSGLPNKNTDIVNFRKVRVQNTSGLDSVVDSKNLLTDGMTSMSDAEKDAWRLAQRKSDETYSTGQPRVDFVFPSYINNSLTYIQPLVLYGINLYIDNQTPNSIVRLNRVEDINGNAVNDLYDVTNFEVSPLKTNQIVLMLDWSLYPKGKYKFKILNGALQSLVSDGFVILNDSVPNQISNLTWTINTNPTQVANSSVLNVSNKSFSYERKGVSAGITEATHTMYSNEELSGNFVVELNVGLDETYVAGGAAQNVYNLGLIASSSSSSSFTLTVLNGFEFKWEWDHGGIFVTDKGYFKDHFNFKLGSGGKIYLLKFQGYITICFITNTGNLIFLSSAIAVNEPMRLFNSFYNQGRFPNKTVSFSYGQIFTY